MDTRRMVVPVLPPRSSSSYQRPSQPPQGRNPTLADDTERIVVKAPGLDGD